MTTASSTEKAVVDYTALAAAAAGCGRHHYQNRSQRREMILP